jgi:predicted MFS family arabinose efflux permease
VKTARIAVPGVALIATTFGLARYGYGLLVPGMRRSFGLDATAAGLLGSGAYVTYLAATVASMPVLSRYGPRRVAIFAGLLATAGMAIIGQASNVSVLMLGVTAAGASSGFAFPPFADVAAEHVDPGRRGDVLAAISSGTGWGVALAAPAAIALGRDWRTAWLTFAAAALVVSATVRVLLPEAKVAAGGSQLRD